MEDFISTPTREDVNILNLFPPVFEEYVLEDTGLYPINAEMQDNVIFPVQADIDNISEELGNTVLTQLENKILDINDNESNEDEPSTVVLGDIPVCLADWTSTHIKQWILELCQLAGHTYEDLRLEILNKYDGKNLMHITEAHCLQINEKKGKWLYDNIQWLLRLRANATSAIVPKNQDENVMDDKLRELTTRLCKKYPKSALDWTPNHIMNWVLELHKAFGYNFDHLKLTTLMKYREHFLIKLNETDCKEIDKKRGSWLFQQLQWLVNFLNTQFSEITKEATPKINHTIIKVKKSNRGRPRKPGAVRRPAQKIGRVWEFLRNLLLDSNTCPSLIYWQDYATRTFRLRDGKVIARLWGQRKNKPQMSYENFSRTIRYYYKYNIILPVPKEKLVYRFGVNATEVETCNPNFGIPV